MDRKCACKCPKTHKLIFDGGDFGDYSISVCEICNSEMDKKFLIEEIKF